MLFMNFLKKLSSSSDIVEFISDHTTLLNNFDCAYLFGSILSVSKAPNDIDLLLIYSEYSFDIIRSSKQISSLLEQQFRLPVDLTILSTSEAEETNFLKRIVHYHKLK